MFTDEMKREAQAAQERAKLHGYGAVQVSKRGYIVVRTTGTGASRPHGENWRAYVSYHTLTRPLPYRIVGEILYELDRAAERLEGGDANALDNTYYQLETGQYAPNW